MDEEDLQLEIKNRVMDEVYPWFERYNFDFAEIEAFLKWKPVVLIIGNYSSGKSTLINELLGREIQRTGQAPTDDSFTVITAPGPGEEEGEISGATLVNDERLPFTTFKSYGDRLSSHFQMKLRASRFLENLAIIDSPGMLDSVTEKGRGYDFPRVVGDFARLADLVILMFDPHKAGTIKETYTTIRNTLPDASREDRIIFVMSRIDECDNLADLIRAYGTLCWNLSQMTGRKDIPRIFLTFSKEVAHNTVNLEAWIEERTHLFRKILEAPKLRINHILHRVDRKLNELKIAAEAMANFNKGGMSLIRGTAKGLLFSSLILFLFVDILLKWATGFPQQTLVVSLFSGAFSVTSLIIPVLSVIVVLVLGIVFFFKWTFPRYIKKCRSNIDQLVSLENAYREQTWFRVKSNVLSLLSDAAFKEILFPHKKNFDDIDTFIREDLQRYFSFD